MKKIKIKKVQGGKPQLPLGGYGFIIGNGTSRKDLNVKQLMDYGVVYACNWFFQEEFPPHVLVCSDEPITKTITKTKPGYPKRNWMYTWFPKPGSGLKKATCPEKFAAGPMAAELAANKHKKEKIFLIGIDFFGYGSSGKNKNGKLNNLYAGKKHYVKGDDIPAPTYRNWQRRFEWILRNYPETEFYHVNPFEGKSPERLRGFPNFHQITFENLEDHLHNDAPLVDILEKTEEDIMTLKMMNEDDVRAVIERQLSGQENVIYKDILKNDQVLQLRKKAGEFADKNKGALKTGVVNMNILGFDMMVPVFTVKEGNIERAARPNEIENIHNKVMQQRSMITEAWRQKGFRGIKIVVQGMPENVAPPSSAPLPPPPPPSPMMDGGLPPPPPPPSF